MVEEPAPLVVGEHECAPLPMGGVGERAEHFTHPALAHADVTARMIVRPHVVTTPELGFHERHVRQFA